MAYSSFTEAEILKFFGVNVGAVKELLKDGYKSQDPNDYYWIVGSSAVKFVHVRPYLKTLILDKEIEQIYLNLFNAHKCIEAFDEEYYDILHIYEYFTIKDTIHTLMVLDPVNILDIPYLLLKLRVFNKRSGCGILRDYDNFVEYNTFLFQYIFSNTLSLCYPMEYFQQTYIPDFTFYMTIDKNLITFMNEINKMEHVLYLPPVIV